MFELTTRDIADLDDVQLRELVRWLCEAELEAQQLPISAVTAGGEQRAPDGGIDVRVDLQIADHHGEFVPRAATGFQVKQDRHGFSRAKIQGEMLREGALRPSIAELGQAQGAYVIVSGAESPADPQLRERQRAMREAVAREGLGDHLHVDFYGGDRIAQWANLHPGVAAWVRVQVGRPLRGWQPYGSWARHEGADTASYVDDDRPRLWVPNKPEPMPIAQGLERMRAVLAQPGTVARLIGLSGLGKTRLVQALFEDGVGDEPLPATLAVYSNSDAPEPSPRDLIVGLLHQQSRAVVVIDNCGPKTHEDVSKLVNSANSTISLVTIEHDVADDQPEGTSVFRLLEASDDTIETLLAHRRPDLDPIAVSRIAALCGGNALLAFALLETVAAGEDVATLRDEAFFKRLFIQRRDNDPNLLRSAEVLSLLYSFEGETVDEGSELAVLAALAETTPGTLFRAVAELRGRQLVQARGPWRALLPHVLANRLADRALRNVPRRQVLDALVWNATPRVRQSFLQRLSLLAGSTAAVGVAERLVDDLPTRCPWGERGLWLSRLAPLVPARIPALVTATAEQAGAELAFYNLHQLLQALRIAAYDEANFEACVGVLTELVSRSSQRQRETVLRKRWRRPMTTSA